MLNSIMYKMSYYRFGELRVSSFYTFIHILYNSYIDLFVFKVGYNQPSGFDRTRGYPIGQKDFTLEKLEEAYTTENWLVRIYKVLKPPNRPVVKYKDRMVKGQRVASKKTKTNRHGSFRTTK